MASASAEKVFHKREVNPYQKLFRKNYFAQRMAIGAHTDQIYDALQNEDSSEVVVTAIEVMRSIVPDIKPISKSEEMSNAYRSDGNKYYSIKKFRTALEYYNRALVLAPDNSHAMKLAYSNRSALLFTVRAFSACIKDINTFFAMGCTDNKLVQRLRHRKYECLQLIWMESMTVTNPFAIKFFKLDGIKRHTEIPCATTDVEVVIESGYPKIVAAKDIPVGKLVAVETPFIGELDEENQFICCHYCHKHDLNLIPCDGCCVALFCNEECRTKSKKAYHSVECKLVSYSNRHDIDSSTSRMSLRAAIKMKKLCKSWKEFVAASNSLGENRIRNSSPAEIYDVKSKFSLLCSTNSNYFIHGARYNQSFVCAMHILALADVPTFFPKETDERDAAIRAFARIMLHLMCHRRIEMYNAALDVNTDSFTSNTERNFGLYSFTCKLQHDCDANLMVFGIKNKVGLVTINPIKKGELLTISYLGHFYENILPERQSRLFNQIQAVCQCKVCSEGWSARYIKRVKLPSDKMAVYRKLESQPCLDATEADDKIYRATCEGLSVLRGAECSNEHLNVFRQFRQITSYCQYAASYNQFIQLDDEKKELCYRN